MGVQKADDSGQCPEGYVKVFGPLCAENTTIEKVKKILPEIPDINPQDPICELLLSTIKQTQKMLLDVLNLARKLQQEAQKLINYPFDIAENMLNEALGAVSDLKSAIDGFVSDALSPLDDLKGLAETALGCPYLADSPFGKELAALLDKMDNVDNPTDILTEISGKAGTFAQDALDNMKEGPTKALANMVSAYENLVEGPISELADFLQKLESCVGTACKMFDMAKRFPKKMQDYVDSIGGKFDSATKKVQAALVRPVNAAQRNALKVAQDAAKLKNTVKLAKSSGSSAGAAAATNVKG